MVLRLVVTATLLICFLLALPAAADNVMAKVSNPAEHAALMELAAAERFLNYNFKPIAVQKLETLLAERPNWQYKPQTELAYAHALMLNKEYERGLSIFQTIHDSYKESKPLIAAWAQYYIADCLNRMARYQEAASACKDTQSFIGVISDLQPVLQAQRKMALLVKYKKVDSSQVFNFTPEDIDGRAWEHAVTIAVRTHCGFLQEAYQEYQQITSLLPAQDKRLAIAGIRLIASELAIYERRKEKDTAILTHAKQLLQDIETSYPSENWLINKGKLTIAGTMVRCNVDLPIAESYMRDVIANSDSTARLPAAYSLLMDSLFGQDKFDEAAETAKTVMDNYPYSTCTDYVAYRRAFSLHKAGKEEQATAMLDQIIETYPDSGWSGATRLAKEVGW